MTATRRRFAASRLAAGIVLLALAAALVRPAGAEAPATGPTVAQLLAACERGQAAGGVGVDAALCEWYAVPCDCAGKRPVGSPRWCVPPEQTIEAALQRVLAVLRTEPRRGAPAASVVPAVMARLYPCDPSVTRVTGR